MQIILERDSIDKSLTFNVCLLQLIFHTSVFTYYIFMQRCFQSSNSAEGLYLLFIVTAFYLPHLIYTAHHVRVYACICICGMCVCVYVCACVCVCGGGGVFTRARYAWQK